MKRTFLTLTSSAILTAGMMFAQTSAAALRHDPQRRMNRIAAALNLTDAQKAQAQSIFQESANTTKPLRKQLRQDRMALSKAAKAGADQNQITALANAMGPLSSQLAAARATRSAKFYALLTPEQQQKVDQHPRLLRAAAYGRHHGQEQTTVQN